MSNPLGIGFGGFGGTEVLGIGGAAALSLLYAGVLVRRWAKGGSGEGSGERERHELHLEWQPRFAWVGCFWGEVYGGERQVYFCLIPCVCLRWTTYAPELQGVKSGDFVRLWPGVAEMQGYGGKAGDLGVGEVQEITGKGGMRWARIWFPKRDALLVLPMWKVMSRELSAMEKQGLIERGENGKEEFV